LTVRGQRGPGQVFLVRFPLDRVQGADVSQRLMSPLRIRKPSVEEVPSDVHPAADVRGPARVHRVVPGVAVGVDEPLVTFEEGGRGVPRPADRQVEHGVGVPGVPDVHPGMGCPPRGEERDRGVVGVQGRGQQDALAHQPVQRGQDAGAGQDLVAQGGPCHLPAQPAEHRLLAVQR
jgi:hypothetical protein